MIEKASQRPTIEITVFIPTDAHADMAVECYSCGNPSNEAISRLASLVLYHTWQDIEGGHRPYWLSSVFEEIEDLNRI